MKINVVPALLAVAASALLAYGLYAFGVDSRHNILLAVGGFICFLFTIAGAVAVRFEQGRTSTNTAVLSWVFFLILAVSHIIFTCTLFAAPMYIIVNGILLIAYIGTTYAVAQTKQ